MLGSIQFFNEEKQFGKIEPDGAGAPIPFHTIDMAAGIDVVFQKGDRVEFDLSVLSDGKTKAVSVRPVTVSSLSPKAAPSPTQSRNCFVVMPFGRTPEEIRWFKGWYQQVIEAGVRAAGLVPVLASAQNTPGAINDEIRIHLAFDPMVVVDLGGVTREADPNPNVMYELGIRHAFNLPLVIMAWEDQRLPFDISNQRAIMERRDIMEIPNNRDKLTKFIAEALSGNFYRPMDAVGRAATLELAERGLAPDSMLRVLAEEFRQLRSTLGTPKGSANVKVASSMISLAKALGKKKNRKNVLEKFLATGATIETWGKILGETVDRNIAGSADKLLETALELAKKYPPQKKRLSAAPVVPALPPGDAIQPPAPLSEETPSGIIAPAAPETTSPTSGEERTESQG
jgi:cold shock CspA family protein